MAHQIQFATHAAARRAPMAQAQCDNLLLRSLQPEDFAWLSPHLEPVPLAENDVIAAQGEPISYVCFPECGVTSVSDVRSDGSRVEIALVGREGMTDPSLLLGCDQSPLEARVLIGGDRSLRLDAGILQDFCAARPGAHALLLRFVHALSVQTARTLASNVRDQAEKRLSRWLLMCHDRLDDDEIRLSHERIAGLLGVRRATVTDTIHVLEGHHLIKNTRGRIRVCDRAGLLAVAGESYGFAEAHHPEADCTLAQVRDLVAVTG